MILKNILDFAQAKKRISFSVLKAYVIFSTVNYLDIILAIFLALGLFRGFVHGLFVELASLIGLIAGIYGAIHFSYYAVDFMHDRVDWSDATINLVAFAVTFIIIVLVISLAARILTKVASFAMLGLINKILGAVFGVLKSAFILSVLLMFVTALRGRTQILDEDIKENSVLYPYIQPLAPLLLPNILKEVDGYRNGDADNDDKVYEI